MKAKITFSVGIFLIFSACPLLAGSKFLVEKMASNFSHSCALSSKGEVKCWGFNGFGQLGLGDIMNRGTDSSQMGENLPFLEL